MNSQQLKKLHWAVLKVCYFNFAFFHQISSRIWHTCNLEQHKPLHFYDSFIFVIHFNQGFVRFYSLLCFSKNLKQLTTSICEPYCNRMRYLQAQETLICFSYVLIATYTCLFLNVLITPRDLKGKKLLQSCSKTAETVQEVGK